ncbi:MAG: hypothetical protein LBV27_07320 [Oscillospiraceae bacterium]|jgi:hypothetical protein|nr:hypothetical protein [Oscillospiraceae bacterium]
MGTKLNYIWRNPNTPEQMEDFLAGWYADAIYKKKLRESKTSKGEKSDAKQGVPA